MFRLMSSTAAMAFLLLGTSTLWACPLCDTQTGQQVRAGIFNGGFAGTLSAMLLPFLVMAGIVALIQVGLPASWTTPVHRASLDKVPHQTGTTVNDHG